MITNLTFINIAVVVVRLHWFRKKLKTLGMSGFLPHELTHTHPERLILTGRTAPILLKPEGHEIDGASLGRADSESDLDLRSAVTEPARKSPPSVTGVDKSLHLVKTDSPRRITFAPDVHRPPESKPLYVPGPRDRDNGMPIDHTFRAYRSTLEV